MTNVDRIDSIMFDLKQSVEDLGNELKVIISEIEKLNVKIELIEKTAK